MIVIGDVHSDAPAGTIKFNANIHLAANNSPNPQFPCDRHNYRTNHLFYVSMSKAPCETM